MPVFGDSKENSVSPSFLWNVINYYLFTLNTTVLFANVCSHVPELYLLTYSFLTCVSFREASAKLVTVVEQNFLFSEATLHGA